MRAILALVVALLFVPTISAHTWSQERDGIAVTLLRIDDQRVHVAWSAAPGAIAYELYRGPSLDDLTLVTQTPTLAFNDGHAPNEDTWYVVVSRTATTVASDYDVGPMRGKCLIVRGLTGISIHMASCMPHTWWP